MKLIPYILAALWLVTSCISRPDYVLDEEAMVSLLTDVHRSEGLLEVQQDNKTFSNNEDYKKAIIAAVLVKHKVTRAQYDSSLVWYGQNLKYLVKVYNKVQKNIIEEIDYWTNADMAGGSMFDVSQQGDSVDLWTVDKHLVMDENRLFAFRFWEIPNDSNFVKGDSLIWHVNVPHVPVSHYLVATLAIGYEKAIGIENCSTVVVRTDTCFDIALRTDTTAAFNSIVASVALLKDSLSVKDDVAFVDSITMIRKR